MVMEPLVILGRVSSHGTIVPSAWSILLIRAVHILTISGMHRCKGGSQGICGGSQIVRIGDRSRE